MPAPPAPSMVRAANTWAANSTGRDVSCNNNRKHQCKIVKLISCVTHILLVQPTEIRHEPKRLHTDCPDEPSKDRLDARRTKIKALIKSPNSDDQSSPKEDLFISKCNAYINEMCRKLGMIALQLLEPIAEYLDTIASHSCQDAEVDAWIAKIEEACHVTLPFLKVAMEGATGTGKSSTINSLINANVAGTVSPFLICSLWLASFSRRHRLVLVKALPKCHSSFTTVDPKMNSGSKYTYATATRVDAYSEIL